MSCISYPMVCKTFFFAPNSPLFGKSGGEKKKKRGNYEAFCLLSKHNKKRISYQMVCKTFFFAPNSPLFGKSGGEKKKKRGNYEAFCFSSKHNKKRINFNAIHFSKIHRSILRKITIDLLYFWDVYDISLWEKTSTEVRLIYAEQMSLYNFIILRKKQWTDED